MRGGRLASAGRRLRALGFGGAVALCWLLGGDPARAAESPAPARHLAPYGLDWIAHVAPADLPASRAAVCLVDSGVAVTPDTPADAAGGPILERLAIDGGPGGPAGSAPAQLHGSRMAMAAIAPANGWGTVGVWPAGRIVSVRALLGEETLFRPEAYRRGIQECVKRSEAWNIAVINLSLTCDCELSPEEQAAVSDAVQRAHAKGISVVAGAGNRPGAPGPPASSPSVLAVAGGTGAGGLCAYSSYDAGVDAVGPACPVDYADPLTGVPRFDDSGGSSTASVSAAMLVALLRTLRPDADRARVEGWLRSSAREVDGRPVLDGEAAAHAAGLDDVLARARARMEPTAPEGAQPAPLPSPEAPAIDTPPGAGPSVAPVVRVRWRRPRLRVVARNRPIAARVQITARWYRGFRARGRVRRTRAADVSTFRFNRRPGRVEVRYVLADGSASPRMLLYPRTSGRYR